jgi:non-homologous end joining protein Ku
MVFNSNSKHIRISSQINDKKLLHGFEISRFICEHPLTAIMFNKSFYLEPLLGSILKDLKSLVQTKFNSQREL